MNEWFPLFSFLEPGSSYRNGEGEIVTTKFQAKLVYRWGAKGTVGLNPEPFYYVPILGAHVGIYISPKNFVGIIHNGKEVQSNEL
jgi:hypothetical protein